MKNGMFSYLYRPFSIVLLCYPFYGCLTGQDEIGSATTGNPKNGNRIEDTQSTGLAGPESITNLAIEPADQENNFIERIEAGQITINSVYIPEIAIQGTKDVSYVLIPEDELPPILDSYGISLNDESNGDLFAIRLQLGLSGEQILIDETLRIVIPDQSIRNDILIPEDYILIPENNTDLKYQDGSSVFGFAFLIDPQGTMTGPILIEADISTKAIAFQLEPDQLPVPIEGFSLLFLIAIKISNHDQPVTIGRIPLPELPIHWDDHRMSDPSTPNPGRDLTGDEPENGFLPKTPPPGGLVSLEESTDTSVISSNGTEPSPNDPIGSTHNDPTSIDHPISSDISLPSSGKW